MADEPQRPSPPAPSTSATPLPADFDPIARESESVVILLPEFEGPLDLLLHLIKKEELEIVDIPISLITERYVAYLNMMKALNIDVAAEYLLMAATLAYLKSRELVPHDDDDAEAQEAQDELDALDSRQQLIRRLLEYQKYKEAATLLGERPVMGRNVWPRGASAEQVAGVSSTAGEVLEEIPVFRLIEALERVLSKARVTLTHDVVVERISLTDKINELIDRLNAEPSFTFASCFSFIDQALGPTELRHQIVITFLAILEMTRLKLLRLHQAADRGEIYVSRRDASAPQPHLDENHEPAAAPPAEAVAETAPPTDEKPASSEPTET